MPLQLSDITVVPQAEKLPTEKSAITTAPVQTDDFGGLQKKYLSENSFSQKVDLWLDHLRRVPADEKIFFTQNLSVMLRSGLPVARALRTLALQTTNKKLKRILTLVFANVEKGNSLSESLVPFGDTFPPIYTNMIKAAESSGQLEEILAELTRQLKKSHELVRKIKNALMYPIAIMVAMTGIGAAMMIFVVPKMISIFTEMNITLPLPTRILIGATDFFNNNLMFIAPITIGTAISLVLVCKRGAGLRFWHQLILHLPIIKSIAKKINLAVITRTLGSLLTADLPIVDSIKLTSSIARNVHYRNSLAIIATNLEKGKSISSLLAQYPKLYPPLMQQMVAVGEESGAIAKVLIELADFYEEDVAQTMEALPSLIEPVLILILGSAVGGMAVAIILPMFKITEAV